MSSDVECHCVSCNPINLWASCLEFVVIIVGLIKIRNGNATSNAQCQCAPHYRLRKKDMDVKQIQTSNDCEPIGENSIMYLSSANVLQCIYSFGCCFYVAEWHNCYYQLLLLIAVL